MMPYRGQIPATPAYLTVNDAAKAFGWSQLRTRRWLNRASLLVRRGRQFVVAVDSLKLEFPEVYERVCLEAYEL